MLRWESQSLIDQTWPDVTVIVVYDSATYMPPFGQLFTLQGRYVHVIRSGAPGPAESRNIGLSLAQSRDAMFLDDDDTLEPTHLRSIGAGEPETCFAISTPRTASIETVSIGDVVAHVRYATGLEIYEDWDFLLTCLSGRAMVHAPLNSVVIHQSPAGAQRKMRRDNTREDLIGSTMLALFQRHPAPIRSSA